MLQDSSPKPCLALKHASAPETLANGLASRTSPVRPNAGGVAPRAAQAFAIPKPLTRIERALLQALRTGDSNKALARQLGKSSHTVRNQLSTLFAKIGVSNRTQALAWLQTHAPVADFVVTDSSPVSSDRFFGTSVLLPGTALPGTMAQHAAAASTTVADNIRHPPEQGA